MLSAVFIATLVGGTGVAGQQSPEDQVAAVVSAFHEALSAGDSATALSHLADGVAIIEGGGIEDKQHYRSGHISGDMRFAQAVAVERGDLEVSILGDVAWAHSISVREGRMGDRDINSQSAELAVLVREGGTWRITAIHWSSRQRRSGG
jgi:ketosteroid isomerase-like protein